MGEQGTFSRVSQAAPASRGSGGRGGRRTADGRHVFVEFAVVASLTLKRRYSALLFIRTYARYFSV